MDLIIKSREKVGNIFEIFTLNSSIVDSS